MNRFDSQITIPDLRFEKLFERSLQKYAGRNMKATAAGPGLRPIGPVTPGIVMFAIIKDIMVRPLLEGFTFAMLLLLVRPTLRLIQANGHRAGTWVAGLVRPQF